MTAKAKPQTAGYDRALAAEPKLRVAVRVVDALCVLTRPSDRMCSGCAWEKIIKPMVRPLLGYERGYPLTKQAVDGPRKPFEVVNWDELFAERDARPAPTSETEAWLRTSEAWDAFVDVLLARLWDADPGNGHGIGRAPK